MMSDDEQRLLKAHRSAIKRGIDCGTEMRIIIGISPDCVP